MNEPLCFALSSFLGSPHSSSFRTKNRGDHILQFLKRILISLSLTHTSKKNNISLVLSSWTKTHINGWVLEGQGQAYLQRHQGTTNSISVQLMDANRATNDEQNGFTAALLGIG
jgi:hypothetical protein